MITSKHFVRLAKKQKRTIYHVVLKPSQEDAENTIEISEKDDYMKQLDRLLEELNCVLPQDMPKGLPPKRSVEMIIDLQNNPGTKWVRSTTFQGKRLKN